MINFDCWMNFLKLRLAFAGFPKYVPVARALDEFQDNRCECARLSCQWH